MAETLGVNVLIETATHARLKDYIADRGMMIGWLATTIVKEWLDKREQEVAARSAGSDANAAAD